jgi:hypothetical protein
MNGITHRSTANTDRAADAELQADVMRFVAILALCLVGISTLVERAGSAADIRSPGTSDGAPAARVTTPAVVAEPTPMDKLQGPDKPGDVSSRNTVKTEPAKSPSSPIGLPVVDGAGSVPSSDTPGVVPAAPRPASDAGERQTTPSGRRGLMLRFESDAALLRMVGRGEAGVFVIAGTRVLALDIRRGVEFNAAPSPARMHVITTDTVPALLRAGFEGPADATWGVTLPGATLDAMRPHIERGDEGVLVIAEDGSVSLETNDA